MPRKPDALKRLKTSVTLRKDVIGFLGRQATLRGKSMSVSRLIEHLAGQAESNPELLLPPLPAEAQTRNQESTERILV